LARGELGSDSGLLFGDIFEVEGVSVTFFVSFCFMSQNNKQQQHLSYFSFSFLSYFILFLFLFLFFFFN